MRVYPVRRFPFAAFYIDGITVGILEPEVEPAPSSEWIRGTRWESVRGHAWTPVVGTAWPDARGR